MKKAMAVLLMALMLLSGCDNGEEKNLVPQIKTITSVAVQRTNIENDEYTYFEKTLSSVEAITTFYDKINALEFKECDPLSYSTFDYVIIWEGKKSSKMVFVGNNMVLDGTSYIYTGKDLKAKITEIYNSLSQEEQAAQSRILENINK